MKRALLLLFLAPLGVSAQDTKSNTSVNYASLLDNLPARCIGPTTMGGRVTDVAVYEKEPRIFYVASASGGIWKTENGGITFEPEFQKEQTSNIGAVAVSQSDPNLVWVGTGEGTSRNSTGYGCGIFKSTDGGKTWTKMGLESTRHFSRVVIDPYNPNVVYAGALGTLWGPNEDRGVYKTTDGGKRWKKLLYVNDKTGVADMAMDPSNNRTLLCAMWEHMRYPYNWVSGGPGSGLYKSTDGGNAWHKLSKGLPKGPFGRIGLSYMRHNPKVVVATVEAKDGTGTYRSMDGGESWAKLTALNPRPFYFSVPRQDPNDLSRIYVPAVSLHYTDDGGKTFRAMKESVHVDHHAMWIDPNDSNHMIIGEDGGVAQTRDRGATWEHLNYMPIGQFYAATYDMRKPYWVYGGLQDNGCWAGPTQSSRGGVAYFDFYGIGGGDGFHVQVDPEDWTTVYSESQGGALQRLDQKYGGGKFIAPRPPKGEKYRANWNTPFIISQYNSHTLYFGGNRLHKTVDRGDTWRAISADLSFNDATKQKPGEGSVTPEDTGAETYNTIITISESPMKEGLLWIGTDDGRVQVTQDDGGHWTDVGANIKNIPPFTWVSRVTASRFAEGRAYVTFDGHRNNDYKTYVYVTEDYGKTWKALNANLPASEPCYVIKEAIHNPDLLFLGTEGSLYISFDRGASWNRYKAADWPTVPVYDLEIQPREEDLIIATHGRSIWTLPIGALEELTKDNVAKDTYFAKPSNAYIFGRLANAGWEGDRLWVSENTQPGTLFTYYLKKDATGDAKITVTDPSGTNQVADLTGPVKAGLNAVKWTPRSRGRTVPAGDYRVTLKVGGKEYYQTLHVEDVTDLQNASPPRSITASGMQQTPDDEDVKHDDGG